jgi:hypothetical protein
MRSHVFCVVTFVVVLSAAGSARATFFNFSTDPNIDANWTKFVSYNTVGNELATWSDSALQLTFSPTVGVADSTVGFTPKVASARNAADAVTMQLSNFTTDGSSWDEVQLAISATQTPGLFDGSSYHFGVWYNAAETGVVHQYALYVNGVRTFSDPFVPTGPIKLDIVPDATGFSFRANGTQIFHDTTNFSVSMPYYSFDFGGNSTTTMSAAVDNFGIAVPEPSALALFATAMLGLLACAWRRRK